MKKAIVAVLTMVFIVGIFAYVMQGNSSKTTYKLTGKYPLYLFQEEKSDKHLKGYIYLPIQYEYIAQSDEWSAVEMIADTETVYIKILPADQKNITTYLTDEALIEDIIINDQTVGYFTQGAYSRQESSLPENERKWAHLYDFEKDGYHMYLCFTSIGKTNEESKAFHRAIIENLDLIF